MSSRIGARLLTAALSALACLVWAPLAHAAYPASDADIEGLTVSAGFSHASLQNLKVEFEECKADDDACTWEAWATVRTAPDNACAPSTPDVEVWRSAEQSGNGSIDSGPLSFGLTGCKGQVLAVSFEFHRTYKGGSPVLRITGGGGDLTFAFLGYEPLAEAEQLILDANEPPRLEPMPRPSIDVWPPRTSSDCRSLYVGDQRYAFRLKRIGCWKATRLVARSWFGASPQGYKCSFGLKGNSGRCISSADPLRSYAWRPPRKPRLG